MEVEPEKCGVRTRQFPFEPCKNRAGMGTEHVGIGACKFHGGSVPNHQRHAERLRIEEGARLILERENLVPVTDPLHELQLLAAETIRFREILGDKVEELTNITYSDLTETEQIRAVVMAFERALDRSNIVLSGMVRLGIEERVARVSQAQAAVMIRVVEAVLESREMALPQDKRQLGRAIVAREVEAVVAAGPAANGAIVPS